MRTPFAPSSPAFWCKSPCVLVHFTLRFGANCTAFWCILHCVLMLFTVQLILENEEKSKLVQTD